jgi:hypothetical protein
MRGLSFEIRADAKFGKPIGADAPGQSASRGQSVTTLPTRGRSIGRDGGAVTRAPSRPLNLLRESDRDPSVGSLKRKLPWGAYIRRDLARFDQR